MKDHEGAYSEDALKKRLMAAECEQAPEAKVATTIVNEAGKGSTVTVIKPMDSGARIGTVPIVVDVSEEAMQHILMDGLWDSIKRMFFPVKPKPPLPIFYVVPECKRKQFYQLVDATSKGTVSSKYTLWDYVDKMIHGIDYTKASLVMTMITRPLINLVDIRHVTKEELLANGFNMHPRYTGQ